MILGPEEFISLSSPEPTNRNMEENEPMLHGRARIENGKLFNLIIEMKQHSASWSTVVTEAWSEDYPDQGTLTRHKASGSGISVIIECNETENEGETQVGVRYALSSGEWMAIHGANSLDLIDCINMLTAIMKYRRSLSGFSVKTGTPL